MPFDDEEDLDSFFDTDDGGAATQAIITDPADDDFGPLTINVIFDGDTEGIAVYGDTNVEAPKPSFLCKSTDIASVKRKLAVTFPNLEAFEDGYGKTYKIERIAREGVNTSRVHLSK